jgi:mono/diheme cytochrome c family protein
MIAAVALFAASATLPASAQDSGYGKSLFEKNCSVCHGMSGAGDGPVAELFTQKPSNLRLLAKQNNGAFPFSEVYQSINGRRDIAAHGNSEMPIWGDLFLEEALPVTIHPGVNAEDIVQGRILALTYYLQSIQEM